MTDKELLELAAKAAGINLQWMGGPVEVRDGIITAWNPLFDDGDALRLAVDLQIKVSIGKNSSWAESIHLTDAPDLFAERFDEGGCKYAAARLAIVRAAAEIGKMNSA